MTLLFMILFATLACVALYALVSATRAAEGQEEVKVYVPVLVDEHRYRTIRQ